LPNLRETSQGKNVILSFDSDIGGALQKACDHDHPSDHNAMHLVRAAKVVRREMLRKSIYLIGHSQKNLRKKLYHSHCWLLLTDSKEPKY